MFVTRLMLAAETALMNTLTLKHFPADRGAREAPRERGLTMGIRYCIGPGKVAPKVTLPFNLK